MSHTVLIIGAGPGGVAAARAVRQYLEAEDRVIVIDRQDEQRLGVTLLSIMRGWHEPEDVTIKPSRVLAGVAEFVPAEATRIDPVNRRVETTTGTLEYDALIVATGAELVPETVPGLVMALENGSAGHCWSLPAALHLRERLRCLAGGRVLIVVTRLPYKCPPAPYEAALLVRDLAVERGIGNSVEVTVITPEQSPLAVAGPEIGRELVALLNQQGITVLTGEQLVAVDGRHREAQFASGRRELFDLLIAVPPHRAPTFVQEAGLAEGDWVPADLRSMRTRFEGIWAIGDVAAVRIRDTLLVPKAAVFAQQQAEVAARDLARWLGRTAPEPELQAHGRCWFLAGRGVAGAIEGDFLAEPRPKVTFQPPSTDGFALMQQDLAAWLAQDPARRH
jgi:sulfide:quinone oxidoreductase